MFLFLSSARAESPIWEAQVDPSITLVGSRLRLVIRPTGPGVVTQAHPKLTMEWTRADGDTASASCTSASQGSTGELKVYCDASDWTGFAEAKEKRIGGSLSLSVVPAYDVQSFAAVTGSISACNKPLEVTTPSNQVVVQWSHSGPTDGAAAPTARVRLVVGETTLYPSTSMSGTWREGAAARTMTWTFAGVPPDVEGRLEFDCIPAETQVEVPVAASLIEVPISPMGGAPESH